jgi:nucleotide-binding universal stress UspA family protein
MSYKRILVPVDGSPVSAKGMKEAVKIARAARARLRLLHVVEEYAAFSSPEVGANVGPILDALRDSGKRTLAKVERAARALGVRPETSLVENAGGRVADSIVEQAKRWRADLIVMGTHGRRGMNRLLVGSDAELVIRNSPIPVLLVPGKRG